MVHTDLENVIRVNSSLSHTLNISPATYPNTEAVGMLSISSSFYMKMIKRDNKYLIKDVIRYQWYIWYMNVDIHCFKMC